MSWRPVFVICQHARGFETRAFEGYPIEGTTTWAVNMRGPGCSSKLIEVVEDRYVHLTIEAADAKRLEMER